MDDNELQLHQ